jgi:hypothetical protein
MNSMTSAIGLSRQTGKGTPATTGFAWLLSSEIGAGAQERVIQLPPEMGGGLLSTGLVKTGVSGSAGLRFIPRPNSLGDLLLAATGAVQSASGTEAGTYVHTFTQGADEADLPYHTIRRGVGTSFGEQITDARLGSLVLDMQALNFVEGQVAFQGIEPTPVADISAWNPAPDRTPPFVAARGVCKINTADTPLSLPVRAATLTFANRLGVDNEFQVGAYFPRDVDVLGRAIGVQFVVFVTGIDPYRKFMYDPSGGAAWLPQVFSSAELDLEFVTAEVAAGTTPYSLKVEAAKSQWTVTPIGMRPNDVVVARVSGIVVQPGAGEAFTLTLTNTVTEYA